MATTGQPIAADFSANFRLPLGSGDILLTFFERRTCCGYS
jgi:hypothetical protein